jgi:hypothetical protein
MTHPQFQRLINEEIFLRLPLDDTTNIHPAHNSSSGYPTIGRSEASDAQTPSSGLVRNLNPNFNAVRIHAIMKTIQCMVPDGSPLALLAQQGAEAANLIVVEKSAGVPRGEPSAGCNNQAGRAQSEAASSAKTNRHLSEHNAHRRIMQNRNTWEYGHNQNDLHNIIEYHSRIRDRTPSPPS